MIEHKEEVDASAINRFRSHKLNVGASLGLLCFSLRSSHACTKFDLMVSAGIRIMKFYWKVWKYYRVAALADGSKV